MAIVDAKLHEGSNLFYNRNPYEICLCIDGGGKMWFVIMPPYAYVVYELKEKVDG